MLIFRYSLYELALLVLIAPGILRDGCVALRSTLHQGKASHLRWRVCGSFCWNTLLFSFFFRTWKQLTVTPLPPLTTLCSCLIMKEVVPKPLVWAPWTLRNQTKTRTMTTWTNGAIASRSWQTCTEVARTTRGLKTNGERGPCTHVMGNGGRIFWSFSFLHLMNFWGGETVISDAVRVEWFPLCRSNLCVLERIQFLFFLSSLFTSLQIADFLKGFVSFFKRKRDRLPYFFLYLYKFFIFNLCAFF